MQMIQSSVAISYFEPVCLPWSEFDNYIHGGLHDEDEDQIMQMRVTSLAPQIATDIASSTKRFRTE